jgi:hypothetical protein
MFIPNPDFCPFRILDPTTEIKEGKFFFILPLFRATNNYYKIVNTFIFDQVKKICLAKTLRMIILFTQKFVISYKKMGLGIRDPGSSTNLSRILGQKGTGSRIRIRNTVILEKIDMIKFRTGKRRPGEETGRVRNVGGREESQKNERTTRI